MKFEQSQERDNPMKVTVRTEYTFLNLPATWFRDEDNFTFCPPRRLLRFFYILNKLIRESINWRALWTELRNSREHLLFEIRNEGETQL